MSDKPDPDALPRRRPAGLVEPSRFLAAIQALSGLLGACGVGVAAAAAHRGGGELAAIAANLMLIHAGVILAVTGLARSGIASAGLAVASGLMLLGTVLFSGELALAGLTGLRPWPMAAPLGGSLLIASWIAVAGCATVGLFSNNPRSKGREERLGPPRESA